MSFRSGVQTFRGFRVPRFNIIGRRRMWFAVSGTVVAISIVALIYPGLTFSIDFQGGAALQMPNRTGASVEEVRSAMGKFGRGDAEVQVVAGGNLAIRTQSLTELGDKRGALLQAVAKQMGVQPDEINVEDVGPSWGSQISAKMVQALAIFLVLVSLYITFRFEWKMAAGAIVALVHDLVITAGVYALFRLEVTPETVIAILTILGFSLYDTVVIYDKVRENVEQPALVARQGYMAVVNMSLNQTIMRSVNTSLVVL
ncbi:MAG: protein translocase subunit SecF, partial [Actinomycetota bacterium]